MDASAADPLVVDVVPGAEGTTVLVVTGELDVHTAPTLSAAVAEAFEGGATSLEVDVAKLQFCDSSGIQVLVQAREQAMAAGGGVKVANARGPVEKVLTVTGLLELFS